MRKVEETPSAAKVDVDGRAELLVELDSRCRVKNHRDMLNEQCLILFLNAQLFRSHFASNWIDFEQL